MTTVDLDKASVFYYFGNHRSDRSIEEILSPAEFKIFTESMPEESFESCHFVFLFRLLYLSGVQQDTPRSKPFTNQFPSDPD